MQDSVFFSLERQYLCNYPVWLNSTSKVRWYVCGKHQFRQRQHRSENVFERSPTCSHCSASFNFFKWEQNPRESFCSNFTKSLADANANEWPLVWMKNQSLEHYGVQSHLHPVKQLCLSGLFVFAHQISKFMGFTQNGEYENTYSTQTMNNGFEQCYCKMGKQLLHTIKK